MKCYEWSVISNHKKIILSFTAILLFFQSSIAGLNIKIKKFCKVKNEYVTLSDIAFIKGNEDPEFIEFLSNIRLTKAPEPPDTKIVTRSEAIKKLKKYHIDTNSIKFSGAQKCLVAFDSEKIDSKLLKKKIRQYIKQKYSDFKIIAISIPEKELYLSKNYKIKIKERNKTKNYLYLTLIIDQDSFSSQKIQATVKFDRIVKVVVAKRDIPKNKLITIEDVQLAEKEIRGRDYFHKYEEVLGSRAKRDIKEGTILKKYMIVPSYKVKKGRKVKIIYTKGNIRIELLGRALQNGKIGDVVKIKNISSGKVVRCKVIGKDLVTVQ